MWQQYVYSGPMGSRPYFVYTPVNYQVGIAVPLVVMLHGCTQTAVDFAAGTQMNQLAEQNNFIVAYPQQTSTYNQSLCWNWFEPVNQTRDTGEAAIIASIVLAIEENAVQWTVDTRQVYVAGLSAGGAMAVILGVTYPDIFAAIGVHSGLEYQAASNPSSAMRVSRQGGLDPAQQGQTAYAAMGSFARVVPTIVFHGTSDYTIGPINGNQVVEQWIQTDMLASNDTYRADFNTPARTTTGQVPGGRSYTVYTWNDADGNAVQVYWKVNRMGHAWSGGRYGSSYTDPQGPDASEAIYTFFMEHPMTVPDMSERDGHRLSFWKNVRRVLTGLFQA